MVFNEYDVAKMKEALAGLVEKKDKITIRALTLKFENEKAREFMLNGFLRRFNLLNRCADNIFNIIPVDYVGTVDWNGKRDAEINIQASIFNVSGAIDNLAWVWVLEKGITDRKGDILPAKEIGLRDRYKAVRSSLTDELRKTVESFDEWFSAIDDYRHSLAHRIPLYIPPFTINSKNIDEFQKIEIEKTNALVNYDIELYKKAEEKQERLGKFVPLIMHSFSEQAKPIVFHPQILANLATVDVLAHAVMDALER